MVSGFQTDHVGRVGPDRYPLEGLEGWSAWPHVQFGGSFPAFVQTPRLQLQREGCRGDGASGVWIDLAGVPVGVEERAGRRRGAGRHHRQRLVIKLGHCGCRGLVGVAAAGAVVVGVPDFVEYEHDRCGSAAGVGFGGQRDDIDEPTTWGVGAVADLASSEQADSVVVVVIDERCESRRVLDAGGDLGKLVSLGVLACRSEHEHRESLSGRHSQLLDRVVELQQVPDQLEHHDGDQHRLRCTPP